MTGPLYTMYVTFASKVDRHCWRWPVHVQPIHNRNNQSLKGAVVVMLCKNEAEVKCQINGHWPVHLTYRKSGGSETDSIPERSEWVIGILKSWNPERKVGTLKFIKHFVKKGVWWLKKVGTLKQTWWNLNRPVCTGLIFISLDTV